MIKSHVKSRFPLETLTTREFKIIQAHLWENEEKEYFSRMYQQVALGVRARQVSRARGSSPCGLVVVGHWLLTWLENPEAPRAFFEVRTKSSHVKTLELYFASEPTFANLADPLRFFISGLFLVGEVDLIRVVSLDKDHGNGTPLLPELPTIKVFYPIADDLLFIAQRKPLEPAEVMSISRSDWRKIQSFDEARRALAYLEKRNSPNPLEQSQRRPRGILRLFDRDTRRQKLKARIRSKNNRDD